MCNSQYANKRNERLKWFESYDKTTTIEYWQKKWKKEKKSREETNEAIHMPRHPIWMKE